MLVQKHGVLKMELVQEFLLINLKVGEEKMKKMLGVNGT